MFGQSIKCSLGISWFTWWIMFLAGTYWDTVWFVKFRRTALKRKWRSESEVGTYWRLLGKVSRNLRGPKGKMIEINGGKGDVLVESSVFCIKGNSGTGFWNH